jgi:hypothetical protein
MVRLEIRAYSSVSSLSELLLNIAIKTIIIIDKKIQNHLFVIYFQPCP